MYFKTGYHLCLITCRENSTTQVVTCVYHISVLLLVFYCEKKTTAAWENADLVNRKDFIEQSVRPQIKLWVNDCPFYTTHCSVSPGPRSAVTHLSVSMPVKPFRLTDVTFCCTVMQLHQVNLCSYNYFNFLFFLHACFCVGNEWCTRTPMSSPF